MSIKLDKKERTFTGCWSCRLRKRRCDVRRPVCTLCAKHDLPCSYEVRLVWLEENIYKTTDDDIIDVLHLDKKRNKVTKNRKHGLSKNEFKDIIHLNRPIDSKPSPRDTTNNDQSFTISVRRFQIYDNEVESVFGPAPIKCYDQKIIDRKLTCLLNALENEVESNNNNNNNNNNDSDSDIPLDKKYRQGPFNAFHVSSSYLSSERGGSYDTISLTGTLSNAEFSMFSPGSDMSHGTIAENNIEYLSELNKFKFKTNQLEDSYTALLSYNEPIGLLSPLTYLDINIQQSNHSKGLKETIFDLLLTLHTSNMVLNCQTYIHWFLKHIKQVCDKKYRTYHLIDEILEGPYPIDFEKYINKLIGLGSRDKELQIIGLTLIILIFCSLYDIEIQIFDQVEKWILSQKCVRYSMYPLINFIVDRTNSCEVFNHCHYLVNTFLESEDWYQESLSFELDRLITEKLVSKWKEKVYLQMALNEDVTESTAQLNYWQLQSKCNEQFYKDIYGITEMSTISPIC
ncbi:Thi2p PWA37_004992 [Arxiozyma heterogenica]|uniref:Thi2p n=1 Tax=Arxiozyma heterogenica TaxID=278026 RepID=UPI002F002B1A